MAQNELKAKFGISLQEENTVSVFGGDARDFL